jgi:hypothetical protein
VLPAGIAVAAAPVPAMPMAPRRPPNGLVKVDAPMVVEAPPPPVVKPVIKTVKVEPAKLKPAPVKKAKVETKPKLKAETEVARKAVKETRTLAKAEKPARKPEKVKLAKAEPKAKKAEEKKPGRLVRLARAVKATPAKVEKKLVKAEPPKESRKARLARLKAEKRKTELAKAEARKLKLAKAEARKPKKAKIEPRGTGPMRVAKANHCASPDPGAAIVCADPRLTSRDRQMQVAYRNAEAAGVPASSLRRQQQRWEAARTAAAREAPWAVEDVYQARIAELNDLARDGNGPY